MRSTSRRDRRQRRGEDLVPAELLHVLWRRRLMILGVALVVVGASAIFSLLQKPVYTAEANVRITPQDEAEANQSPEAFVRQITSTVRTQEMLREAAKRSGWGSAESFEKHLTVEPYAARGGGGITVRFTGPREEGVVRSANAYAALFVQRVGKLGEDRLVGGSLAADASVEKQATLTGSPSSPRPLVYAALAAVAGSIAGGAAALVLESRTRSWRDARDAEITLRAPVLGVIPEHPSAESRGERGSGS